ncbi:DUF3515 domain-containing protein [Zhihengliuella halotolerans]|uniref:DUF3515 domain-containing protein n=1 Tax=Zhihengliuella halotolerans TaxID=370736 RepID=UPI0021557504|nr:DUF3515 domain-containing protein [Zhihengliuella halotolerans]
MLSFSFPGSVTKTSARQRYTGLILMIASATGLTLLSACASVVDVEPAPGANDPSCARTMVILPDEVSGFERRDTNSQATAVWGDPAAVVLRCGVESPSAVTTDPCVTANGVDWIAREGEDAWTLTTYGREPATEVLFDPTQIPSSNVLPELAAAVQAVESQAECLSTQQEANLP